jgi:hypothetical protein
LLFRDDKDRIPVRIGIIDKQGGIISSFASANLLAFAIIIRDVVNITALLYDSSHGIGSRS